MATDQHWNIKTEVPDAAGDLSDLPFSMNPWVAGIEFQLIDQLINDLEGLARPDPGGRAL